MNHGQYPYNQNNQQQYQQQYQQQQHDDYSHTHRLPDESPPPQQQQQQQPLPHGWVEATDNTGRIYYCNPRTQETRWDRPENLLHVSNHLPQQYQQQQQQQQQPQQYQQISPLPPGWVEATDNTTGKIYYCNPQTRETKWERPSTISTTPRGPEMIESYNDNNNYDNSNNYNNNNHGISLSTMTTTTIPAIAMPVATGVNNAIYASNNHNQTCNNNSNNDTSANVIGSNAAHINNNNNREGNSNDNFDELRSITTGQIARLCKVQQRQAKEHEEQKQQQPKKEVSTTTTTPSNTYIPINLSTMSWLSVAERAEPGRLDVRIHSLREELNKFGYIQSS